MAPETNYSKKYDVFLSYRRNGGETMAILLYERLAAKGYNVFLDIESLNSGSFNKKLLSVIEGCTDVVFICSPRSLDRCVNAGDWVRMEIAHAFKHGKNVVPVLLRDFDWPADMPDDIAELRVQGGVSANNIEFFDAAVERLASKFLQSTPCATTGKKPKTPPRQPEAKTPLTNKTKGLLAAALSLIVVAALVFGGIALWGKKGNPASAKAPEPAASAKAPAPADGYITIKGKQYSTSLTQLDLTQMGLQNEDIVPLQYMKNLTELVLARNQISDLTPLSGLAKLTNLGLQGNSINNLKPLSGLANLTKLTLWNNHINDLAPLSDLTKLTSLSLQVNDISNLKPLSGLANLTELILWGNQISDVKPLSNLAKLTNLELNDNPITDWSPVAHVTSVVGRPESTKAPASVAPAKSPEPAVGNQPTVSAIQPKESGRISPPEQAKEDGVIAFSPAGTLLIKTLSGEEFKAILNTVSGFPVSFYISGTENKLALDAFSRAEFSYQNKDEYNKTLTIRTYDDYNKETVLIKDYDVSSMGTISFLTDNGMRFLALNQIAQMTKDESQTPPMPGNVRHVYIRSGGMVYKVPQPLLKYFYYNTYYGISCFGGDIIDSNSLKYVHVCKKTENFKGTTGSVAANVYFNDKGRISTALANLNVSAQTDLGEIHLQIANVDDIFFGDYDTDFAKKVASDAWDGDKTAAFTGKGIATIYKKDGTKSVLALNSLMAVGSVYRTTSSYSTAYLKTDYERVNTANGADTPPLFFSNVKSLKINVVDNYLSADYILYSGEVGKKSIRDDSIEGLAENGKESISLRDVEKIDFDKNHDMDLSRLKKVVIVGKNGCVFEALQATVYFGYIYSSGYIPSISKQQIVKIEGGLSVPYEKIKKIEFLPERKDGEVTRYPAKITLRSGGSQELLLDIGGYYNSYLYFLTSLGMFSYNLRTDVQSIEFM